MEEDRFRSLPDDILLSIVSLLQFKEAARTSVLSRRWAHLWKGTGRLNFDAAAFFSGLNMLPESSDSEQGHLFADWVCQVLNHTPRSNALDEFKFSTSGRRIQICNQVVDGWINFAVQKRVKKLELSVRELSGNYSFSSLPLRNGHFKSLVVLRTTFVQVTGEDIGHFAANCPYLEELMVWYSRSLVDVDIKTPMSRLKSFDVSFCLELKRLHLYAPNLLSFSYVGFEMEEMDQMVPLKKDVLCLDKLRVGMDYLLTFLFIPSAWQSYQVKRLELDLYLGFTILYKCGLYLDEIVKFGNLRELYIRFQEERRYGVQWITSFIKASPLLHSLHVEMVWYSVAKVKVGFPDAFIEVHNYIPFKAYPHNLRDVVLTECCSSPATFELIIYLVKNATCLEKLTISFTNMIDPRREEFVEWVMELKTQFPLDTTEIVII